jgi:gluconate kinase
LARGQVFLAHSFLSSQFSFIRAPTKQPAQTVKSITTAIAKARASVSIIYLF